MIDIDTAAIRRMRDYFLNAEITDGEQQVHLSENELSAVMRRAEPFAETMYLVMMADGDAGDDERRALTGAFHVLTQGAANEEIVAGLLSEFEQRERQQGVQGRLQQLGAHLSANAEDRETAFALGAVVALADHTVDVRESAVIQSLAEFYGVSSRRVGALLNDLD